MITKICPKHKCVITSGKCNEFDIDEKGNRVPCESPLEETSAIFWCKNCNVPSFYSICPECKEKLEYLCTDIRPVFPEEKLLYAILQKKEPSFYQKSSIWCSANTYIIDGKKEKFSVASFNSLSLDEVKKIKDQYDETPSERAKQIQSILDITDVKKKADYISKTVKEAKKTCDEIKHDIDKVDSNINSICEQDQLDSINRWRQILGAADISKIESDSIIGELSYKEDAGFSKKRNELVVYQKINEGIEDYKEKILLTDSKIRQILVELGEASATADD